MFHKNVQNGAWYAPIPLNLKGSSSSPEATQGPIPIVGYIFCLGEGIGVPPTKLI